MIIWAKKKKKTSRRVFQIKRSDWVVQLMVLRPLFVRLQ